MENDKPYSIRLWESHPDEENDDCDTGSDYATKEEALAVFNAADPILEMSKEVENPEFFAYCYALIPFIEIDGPDINQVRQLRKKRPIDNDDDWRREQAMQAGMAFGCDGYNEVMGYD